MSNVASPTDKDLFWTIPRKYNWRRLRAPPRSSTGPPSLSVRFARDSPKYRLCCWVMRHLCQSTSGKNPNIFQSTWNTKLLQTNIIYHYNRNIVIPWSTHTKCSCFWNYFCCSYHNYSYYGASSCSFCFPSNFCSSSYCPTSSYSSSLCSSCSY